MGSEMCIRDRFEFRRKKQSCNEDHQDAQECCDQIHRCPSDGLLLLFARIVHGPTKIRSSCIKKNSFLRLQRVVFCVSTYSWVPTRHPLPRTRRWRNGLACSFVHCSRPNQYAILPLGNVVEIELPEKGRSGWHKGSTNISLLTHVEPLLMFDEGRTGL